MDISIRRNRPNCFAFFIAATYETFYNEAMDKVAKRIIFKGRVQGVGFRYTTQRAANRYDLAGLVRNLPDGSVEAFLQGTSPNIQACLDDLKDAFGGYLREINMTDQPINSRHHDFRISY